MWQEILEKYYAAECAINSYQKGIQQQLGIMRGLIHRLDARRERSVHSPTVGHSGYAAEILEYWGAHGLAAGYAWAYPTEAWSPRASAWGDDGVPPRRVPTATLCILIALRPRRYFVCVAKLGHIYFVLAYVYSE